MNHARSRAIVAALAFATGLANAAWPEKPLERRWKRDMHRATVSDVGNTLETGRAAAG